MPELVIDRLTKHFKNKIAVDGVSLRLQPGVYGFLGANGAGKTTLLRMLVGVLKPTSGKSAVMARRFVSWTGNTVIFWDISPRILDITRILQQSGIWNTLRRVRQYPETWHGKRYRKCSGLWVWRESRSRK